jgi:hypothetical protein
LSSANGFLYLGGGLVTFSTNNNSIVALLFTLYPLLLIDNNYRKNSSIEELDSIKYGMLSLLRKTTNKRITENK